MTAYITKLTNVHKHPNADKLLLAECFGNQVIVGLDSKEGDLGIYFPTDMQIGMEYAEANGLLRKKDENGNNTGGYLDPNKRHIRTMKLRGELSDGLFMPIDSLSGFTDISKLKQGEVITVLGGLIICQKYIPKINKQTNINPSNKKKKKKPKRFIDFPLFEEHKDTKQFAYNKHMFKEGDKIVISLKQHGSSGRTSFALQTKTNSPTIINRIAEKLHLKPKEIKTYEMISGSRRVILYDINKNDGYYNDNGFRKKWHEFFEGKLHKGETVYYEIVGYVNENTPIMGVCNNKKLGKQFVKEYGEETIFNYGCQKGENDVYVYRMTITNEDGYVVEYPTSLILQRCEEMGVKPLLVLDEFTFTTIEDLKEKVYRLCGGVDPIGLTHIREGVVIRIENKSTFTAYKHKNTEFKILEGIIKDSGFIDLEEQESIKTQDDEDTKDDE